MREKDFNIHSTDGDPEILLDGMWIGGNNEKIIHEGNLILFDHKQGNVIMYGRFKNESKLNSQAPENVAEYFSRHVGSYF